MAMSYMYESPLEIDDLITSIMTFLHFKEISRASATSTRFNKATNTALKYIRNVSLYIYDLSDTDIDITIYHSNNHCIVNLSLNMMKNNHFIVNMLKTIWKNVRSFHCEHHDIGSFMKHLGLPDHQIQDIRVLAVQNSYLNYIPYLSNLRSIETQYADKNLWNQLINHCPHLRDVSFEFDTQNTYPFEDDIQFELAPNVEHLSIYFEGDTLRDLDIANDMIQSTPNLKYLQMIGSDSIGSSESDDVTNNTVRVPSGLMALEATCSCLHGIAFDVSKCTDLRLIHLEICFYTENIEIVPWPDLDWHRCLSVLLKDFLQQNVYTSFQKTIAISLDYDSGTPNVSADDKLTAITQFKSLLEEENNLLDAYRNSQQLTVVSTKYSGCQACPDTPDPMVDVWADELFAIPKERIVKAYDANDIVYKMLSEHRQRDDELI
eukprot:3552_1